MPEEPDGKKKDKNGKVGRPGKGPKPTDPGKAVGKPAKPPRVVVKPVTPAQKGQPDKGSAAPKGKGPVVIVSPPKPAQDKDTGPQHRPPAPAQQAHPTDADRWEDAQPHPTHRDKAPKPAKGRHAAQVTAAVEPPSAPRPIPADHPGTGNGNGKGKSKGGAPQAAPAPPAAAVDTGRAVGGPKTKNPRGR